MRFACVPEVPQCIIVSKETVQVSQPRHHYGLSLKAPELDWLAVHSAPNLYKGCLVTKHVINIVPAIEGMQSCQSTAPCIRVGCVKLRAFSRSGNAAAQSTSGFVTSKTSSPA